MAKLTFVHWKPEEVQSHVRKLEAAGHKVIPMAPFEDAGREKFLRTSADAIVVSLDRLPSHGRALGTWLRQRKATRGLPLVYVAEEPARLEKVRAYLPDATFTSWRTLRGAVTKALRAAPREPHVPGTMDACSKTPLAKKLGIKDGVAVGLLGAPQDFESQLGDVVERVTIRRQARGTADVVVLFCKSIAELERKFAAAARMTAERGRIWLAWPKKASGMSTDVTQTDVRAYGLDRNWVDFKIAAIDGTWSGLCFARRRSGKRGL